VVERLVALGARVRAFVRYNSRNDPGLLAELSPETLGAVELIAGDLRDPAAVEQAMGGTSVVFHLGALIAIPYSYQHPYEVVETNVVGTLNVLTTLCRCCCRPEPTARLSSTACAPTPSRPASITRPLISLTITCSATGTSRCLRLRISPSASLPCRSTPPWARRPCRRSSPALQKRGLISYDLQV